MDILIDFLLNNYIWFLVISLIILFALIGYLVDASQIKEEPRKKEVKPILEEKNTEFKVHPSVQAYTSSDYDDPLIK